MVRMGQLVLRGQTEQMEQMELMEQLQLFLLDQSPQVCLEQMQMLLTQDQPLLQL